MSNNALPKKRVLGRLLMIALLFGGFTFATAAEADAGIFGRSSRSVSKRSSGYAIRGVSPITVRVSSAKYRRLTTFYPNVYRRR